MTRIIDQLKTVGLVSASVLLLAACGNQKETEEAAVETDAVATTAMPAEESLGDMGMDSSATDAMAEMAPPADPMMDMPGTTPPAEPAQ